MNTLTEKADVYKPWHEYLEAHRDLGTDMQIAKAYVRECVHKLGYESDLEDYRDFGFLIYALTDVNKN